VQNAVGQARYGAANLTGSPLPYRDMPWFWSRQGALNIQIAGFTNTADTADTRVPRGDAATCTLAVFCFRAGEFVGVEAVNRPADYLAGRHLLASGIPLSPNQAADPTFDLRSHSARPL
jgi:3-phenylpropionate/trans-cinnamate dioxygenase ferredoxin reductase subunit